ncbi:MAG: hypothetical protein ACOYYU_04765 [Chloroflexota bacterium]
MAKNQNKRLAPAVLQADQEAFTALQSIGDYAPANAAYAKDAVQSCLQALRSAQKAEINAQNALAAARDAAAAAEWEFHNMLLGVKEQVIAQYGKNSDQVQALGLKKKAEYKAPGRKTKPSAQEEGEPPGMGGSPDSARRSD